MNTIVPLAAFLSCFAIAANAISAVAIVWLMQRLTLDAGVRCNFAVLLLAQRLGMAALAIVMFWNAYDLWDRGSPPRLLDVIEQGSFMLVLLTSMARHYRMPPLPSWASWRDPAFFSIVSRLTERSRGRSPGS